MITITGGAEYQKKRVDSIVRYCLNALMPRLVYKVDVHVSLSKTLRQRQGILGSCTWDDTNHFPRSFLIELDSTQRLRSLMITTAHEMVHVKQFARNEHKQMLITGSCKWMGRTINTNKVDYWDLPWEIEANGREVGLFLNWSSANDLQDAKWTLDKNDF